MTNLTRHISQEELDQWKPLYLDENGNPREGSTKTIPQGASTTLTAAFDPRMDAVNGSYLVNCQVAKDADGSRDFISQANLVQPYAKDKAAALRFFELADKLTGEKF